MPEKTLINDKNILFVGKLFGYAVLLGMAWARMEYKFDESTKAVIKKLDEHIISDGYEKQMLRSEISQLKKNYDDILNYAKSEFVRPDDIRMRRERR